MCFGPLEWRETGSQDVPLKQAGQADRSSEGIHECSQDVPLKQAGQADRSSEGIHECSQVII